MVRRLSLLASAVLVVCASSAWALQEGDRAPAFSLPTINGDTVSLDDFRGKTVALAFWASWAKHCAEQLKQLDLLQTQFREKGLVVLAINQQEQPSLVADFADLNQLSVTMLLDSGSVARAFTVNGVPDLWIVDREGKLLARSIGYADAAAREIRAAIEAALAEPEKRPEQASQEVAAAVPPKLQAYAHLQMGAAHINVGDAFVKAGYRDLGHFDEALREFRAGLLLDPQSVDLHIWLGLALERKADLAGAAREYQAALKLDSNSVYAQDALRRLGVPTAQP
jgi:peroxiredoxin